MSEVKCKRRTLEFRSYLADNSDDTLSVIIPEVNSILLNLFNGKAQFEWRLCLFCITGGPVDSLESKFSLVLV